MNIKDKAQVEIDTITRIALNMLVEVMGNHSGRYPAAVRDKLKDAITALSDARQEMR